MRNIQFIDRADNATFSLFQATDEEFDALFPDGRDMELIEDVLARLGEPAGEILSRIRERPILKRDAQGVHGTLFYGWEDRRHFLPETRREVDWPKSAINPAQRRLFAAAKATPAAALVFRMVIVPPRPRRSRPPRTLGDDPVTHL